MEENTKVLSWNISHFNINKIGMQVEEEGGLALLEYPRRGYNRFTILETVQHINPDVFIVIEVTAGRSETGTLIQGNGQLGLLALLADLRRDPDKDWCLVPAPNLLGTAAGRGEAIGVFYQNRRLQFVGPQVWPANSDDYSVAVAPGAATGPYPAPWNACLPLAERTMAAHVAFREDGHHNLIGFPQRTDRNPMLTRFVERHHRQRTINLVSVHLPPISTQLPGDGSKAKNPKGIAAQDAIAKIWNWIPGLTPPPENGVTVIAGDFNLDRNNPNVVRNLLLKTETTEDEWLFDSPQNSMYQYKSKATPSRYIGGALNDNALLRYYYDQRPGILRGFVADIVNGTADVVPGTAPGTYPQVLATLDVPLAQFLQYPESEMLGTFRLASNYGHVAPSGGVSNHRPIYLEA